MSSNIIHKFEGEVYAGEDLKERARRIVPDIIEILSLQHWSIDVVYKDTLSEDDEDTVLTPAVVDHFWLYKKAVVNIALDVILPAETWVTNIVHEFVHLTLATYETPLNFCFNKLKKDDRYTLSFLREIANEQAVEGVVRALYNSGALDNLVDKFKK